ncbi:MAG: hypothetical protein AB8G15_23095 [Saprospiraceae bacterium]
MNFITKIKTGLHHRYLQSRLKSHRVLRKPKDFKESISIGILFDATDPETKYIIDRYVKELQQRNKQVRLFAFSENKTPKDNLSFKSVNQNDLDWALRPNTREAIDFMNQQFDILINLYLDAKTPLAYLSSFSMAHLRVGPYTDKSYCYDLMIETENNDLNHFVQQVDYFLNKMNSRRHATITI